VKPMFVIVSGAIANRPGNAGGSWVRWSWMRGLERLGCQVFLLDQIRSDQCVDEAGAPARFEDSANLAYFQRVVSAFGLEGRAALISEDGLHVSGARLSDLDDMAGAADLLVNITGHLSSNRLLHRIRRRAYIDIDPGFTQYWHAAGIAGTRLDNHDLFFTIGEHIGTPGCSIPTNGVHWRHVRQPVVLEDWPVVRDSPHVFNRFTTISSWRGAYGRLEVDGRTLGTKAHEFRKFLELPSRTAAPFEIALDIHPAESRDIDALATHGWMLVNPVSALAGPADFRAYIQASSAEFSVAQPAYVETGSGWFSDRTIRYLASGRPALVQDTGFSRLYPSDEGLVAFRTMDEAVEGARRIVSDYPAHSQAARHIAEQHFDSARVLERFLDEVQSAVP
jgi:hypothetical protein